MSVFERLVFSMDKDWSFHLGDIPLALGRDHGTVYALAKAGRCPGVPAADFNAADWELVTLPHDWSVKRPFDRGGSPSWGYKPKGKAWYRKAFYIPEEYDGKNITITFQGVAKDCTVYFNGSVIARNHTAYAPFTIDITDRAYFGITPNVLAVFVDADGWEGWWYEGAGIYRHVDMTVKNKTAVAQYGIFAAPSQRSDGGWDCPVEVTLENTGYEKETVTVNCEIFEKESGKPLLCGAKEIVCPEGETVTHTFEFIAEAPLIWDIDSPRLHTCRITLDNGDGDSVDIGFRSIRFDAQEGFFLNGRSLKIFGTCNHQDHGGVGVAVPDSLHEYRIAKLKEMGSNAYRCAHGMPPQELLDVCDRMGMLVMDENRNFETSQECLGQLRKMVLRDRNHPSVFMYSIFNEEPLQGTVQGGKMAVRMRNEIHRLDPTRFVTGAMSGGIMENAGAAEMLDVCGINYQMWAYDDFHNKYPDLCMIGSEDTSTFSVRGCYKTEYEKNLISCYDEDPSDWGNTVRKTWETVLGRKWASGAFMWTGFDYLGEPTPFTYPSVSSFFGMMDICGAAKDGFYLCQAIFKKEPIVHVLPHWNWQGREGEIIRVMSHTNCEEAELFVNGKSFGRRKIELTKQTVWEVPYEPGELRLVGYNDGKIAGEDVRHTTKEVYEIRIEPWKDHITGDGIDALPVDLTAYDCDGREVPDFNGQIELFCDGGEIIGTANGDPNCHEEFTSHRRSLFNGRAQAIVRCNSDCLTLRADCGKIKCNDVRIEVLPPVKKAAVESVSEIVVGAWRMSAVLSDERPDPYRRFSDSDMNSLEPVDVCAGAPVKFEGAFGKYALYRADCHIPTVLNNKPPVLRFNQIWGKFSVYIGRELVAQGDNDWGTGASIQIDDLKLCGDQQITVIVQSNNSDAGIISSVVIR